MKNILHSLIIFLLFISISSAMGQIPDHSDPKRRLEIKQIQTVQSVPHHGSSNTREEMSCDTLDNFIPEDVTFFVYAFYPAPESGWLGGHNNFLDISKAEKYIQPGEVTVTGVDLVFGEADYISEAEFITVNLWSVLPGGTPGSILASENITLQEIEANVDAGLTTHILFDSPVLISDSFFAGFSMNYPDGIYNPQQDVSVLCTDLFGEITGSADRNTAWEQWSDGSWHDFFETYGVGGSMTIFPIVCTTDGDDCTSSIGIPKDRSTTNVTTTSAMLNWSPVGTPDKYKIRYKSPFTDATVITIADGSATSYFLTGLEPSTPYVWRIEEFCGTEHTPYSRKKLFVTDAVRAGEISEGIGMNVFPNPVKEYATIQFSVPNAADVTVILFDLHGRKIKTIAEGTFSEGTYHITLEMENTEAGIYFLQLKTGTTMVTQKLIIQ